MHQFSPVSRQGLAPRCTAGHLKRDSPPPGVFADFDDAAWQDAFDLLLLGVVRMVREALPHLRASEQGRIITVASTSVKQLIPGLILSNSLRAGVLGLLKTLADEVAPNNITVNTVLPGSILTDRLRQRAAHQGIAVDDAVREAASHVPRGRVGAPADLGALVAFLCSDAAGYITGAAIPVDGGVIRGL